MTPTLICQGTRDPFGTRDEVARYTVSDSVELLWVEDGDHDRFSHYVKKDKILQSALSGKPVRALCGKKWTPGRDPEKFPICPTCKDI